jgi:hypothetical protein
MGRNEQDERVARADLGGDILDNLFQASRGRRLVECRFDDDLPIEPGACFLKRFGDTSRVIDCELERREVLRPGGSRGRPAFVMIGVDTDGEDIEGSDARRLRAL